MIEKIVLKPEIVDQRKLLKKGENELETGDLNEALRLFQKAHRIYEDNRTTEALKRVEESIEKRDAKLAEIAAKRTKYDALTPEDKKIGKDERRSFCSVQ